jgi:hypothetical protein
VDRARPAISGLEDEYVNAGGMPKLVYLQSPAPDRDPRLTEMLGRIQSDGLSSMNNLYSCSALTAANSSPSPP